MSNKSKRFFSALDVLRIIPTNMVPPFMYLVDIIKDSLQLSILLISIGGIKNVIQNPTSFSSQCLKHKTHSVVALDRFRRSYWGRLVGAELPA